jgi:AbrB family looped-hinge helix DNA binding protein
MASRVGPKGQVVIEKAIRDRLGVRPGSVALQTLAGDRVEIRFLPPEHTESLYGILSQDVRAQRQWEWSKVKERAWQGAAHAKEEASRQKRARKRGRR